MDATLIYVHDPMCSWCWGFEPTRKKFFAAVEDRLPIRRLVGGLAPDSDVPMAEEMRAMLQQTWQRIQQTIPGTEFNFHFWQVCTPRRSTYPANRAVLAARLQGEGYDPAMTHRIQQAYYLEARKPQKPRRQRTPPHPKKQVFAWAFSNSCGVAPYQPVPECTVL